VECALAGRTNINEYSIGVDVFGRDESFDPRIDPIVRVDARRLRAKLREYYDGEGAENPIEICIPLRTYIPVFCKLGVRCAPEKPLTQICAVSRARESIGVFPFTSLSVDREDAFFAGGLTAELVHALAALNEWRVVAGEPAACGTRRPDLREMASELNIDVAVWGTVRKAESIFRVSAEFFTVQDRTVLLSQMYEAPVDKAVPMQTEIARAIRDALCSLREVPRMAQSPLPPTGSSSTAAV
jgi:serine/threonine-protein kinase